jgi:meso-butanediol dehydrogenase/(S,S)-butanediol dehydrogenase/diacetyl reductase
MVTGAGQGIGRAIALRLAREGFDVAILDVNAETARAVSDEVEAIGRRALTLVVDLLDVPAIELAVERVAQEWDHLDVLVNNAGNVPITPLMEIGEAEWDRVLDLNLKAAFFCLQAAGRVMMAQRGGCIINMTSISGLGPRPDQTHYAAAKAGVISLTASAALTFAPYGVRVNAVCPGIVDTPLTRQIHLDRGHLAGISQGVPGTQGVPDSTGAHRDPGGRGRRGGLPGVARWRLHHRSDDCRGWGNALGEISPLSPSSTRRSPVGEKCCLL